MARRKSHFLNLVNLTLIGLCAFFYSSSVSAQTAGCTPDVEKNTCDYASRAFVRTLYLRNPPDITIVGADTFKRKGDLLKKEYDSNTISMNLKFKGGSAAPFNYSYSEYILFIRGGDDACPSSILVSTDAFRPFKFDNTTNEGEFVEGFEFSTVRPVAEYVGGYVDGCRRGIGNYVTEHH